jgi:CCT motif
MTHMAHMDETYLHLVTSLLMEKDTLFRADRSDSMTSEDRDDFLPLVSEFLIPQRDRAFSWDVSFEEGLSGEAIQALIAEQTRVPFYKPMLPPTTVSTKLSVNKSPAIVEDENSGKAVQNDSACKRESIPMKKRKIPEKSENNSKKIKGNDRSDTLTSNSAVPRESEFANSFIKKFESTASPASRQQISSVLATDSKGSSSTGKKVSVKAEDKLCTKSVSTDSNSRSQVHQAQNLVSSQSIGLKSSGHVTPIPTSPSYQQQMAQPQPAWTDYGVYQTAATDMSRCNVGTTTSSSNSSLPSSNLSRIPLLASDFGPANGIVIGDGCRVGVYTREERLVRIERFREKKLKRIWRKQIKYDCRKRLADTRPRVKGRFVSRIGENGEELPPEPKPDSESLDSKKKKKKLPKSSPTVLPTTAVLHSNYTAQPVHHMGPNAEGVNSGDTTQESEEDAGDSICSDELNIGGELTSRMESEPNCDRDGQTLDDSLGHIIDIICGGNREEM